MSQKIQINTRNAFNYFYFQAFSSAFICAGFDCGITEYNDYLLNDALRSADDHIAFTWLLTERKTEKVIAYMSLIMDSIKLSFYEKNGFIPNAETFNKKRKTISMRKDIFQ